MKNIFTTFIIILLLGWGPCIAQKTSDLKQKLSEAKADTAKVILLARLGFEYAFIDLDSSRQYCNEGIQIAKQIGFIKGQANAVNSLAISYDVEGNHKVSLGYFLEALDLYEEINFKEGSARIYNNCGMVYQNLGEIAKSLEFHNRSLQLEIEFGDSVGIAYSMIHIASISLEQQDYVQANEMYSSSLLILKTLNDEAGLSHVYLGLGEMYFYQKKINMSLTHLTRALDLFKTQEDKKGVSEAYLLMGKASILSSDLEGAENQLLMALKISEDLDAGNIISEALLNIAVLYKTLERYKESIQFYERYLVLQDSIGSGELAKNINEIQSKYDFEKQEQEIVLLSTEKEYQTNLRNVVIAVLVVTSVLLFILFRMNSFKSKALKILKSKNEEIKHKNTLIEGEKKNALDAAQVKSDFLSVMSHEIRTPMNAIIGTAHLLLLKDPKPDQMENLHILKYSADNLLVLINDILDLTKLESDKLTVESAPFSLTNLTQGMLGIYKNEAHSRGIQFELTVAKEIPNQLIGDPGRLSQVLNNLISNAMKFTEKGFVRVYVMMLDLKENKVDLKFMVEDTGIGIEAEKIDLIFEKFSQADSNTTRKYGGTGLGLSITKHILDHLGSQIYLESKVGTGSKFSFELSFDLQAKNGTRILEDNKVERINDIKGKKVLVVDDNKANLLIAKGILNNWGVDYTLAESGKQALIELSKSNFDLILLDLRMPDMDGYEVTQKVRALEGAHANIPIVALSATVSERIKDKVLQNGMNDYLAKPFDPEKLLDIIYQQTRVGLKLQWFSQ